MSFSHLKPEKIREIKKFFTDNRKRYDNELRSLMLGDMNFVYQQSLTIYSNEQFQLGGDLDSLNSLTRLEDGTVPLEIWLKHGLEYLSHLQGKTVFDEALAEMKSGPDETSDIEEIVKTFKKLSQLIRHNDFAYDSVKFYGRIFQTAITEFEVIDDYKSMHDTLHQLQLFWKNIATFLDLYEKDRTLRSTVMNYATMLDKTVKQLNEIHKQGAVPASEKEWIDVLAQQQKNFKAALNENHRETIEDVFHEIKNHIGTRLSLLNTSLKNAISHLHLKDLIDAMDDLCKVLKRLSPPELAAAQVAQYQKGVEQMSVLHGELTKLILQHDEWQKMDSMLHTLGDVLGEDADQPELRSTFSEEEKLGHLKLILNIIEKKITPLLQAKPTESSENLLNAAQDYKTAIISKDTDLAERWFGDYREQAWHYFFDLDAEMKAKCSELKVIGDNLRKVNDELVEKTNEE